jgi:hypothetical protein
MSACGAAERLFVIGSRRVPIMRAPGRRTFPVLHRRIRDGWIHHLPKTRIQY